MIESHSRATKRTSHVACSSFFCAHKNPKVGSKSITSCGKRRAENSNSFGHDAEMKTKCGPEITRTYNLRSTDFAHKINCFEYCQGSWVRRSICSSAGNKPPHKSHQFANQQRQMRIQQRRLFLIFLQLMKTSRLDPNTSGGEVGDATNCRYRPPEYELAVGKKINE